MTDTPVETTPDAVVETPAAPEFVPDEVSKALAGTLPALIADAKRAQSTIDNDPDAFLANLRDTSENPEIVRLREGIEKIIEKMNEILKPEVPDVSMSTEDAQTLFAATTERIKVVLDSGNHVTPGFRDWALSTVSGLSDVRLAKRTSGANKGDGPKRPRVVVTVDGKRYDNMTMAAKFLEIPTSDMHAAWAKAAGQSDVSLITQDTRFDMTVKDKPHAILVQKKVKV